VLETVSAGAASPECGDARRTTSRTRRKRGPQHPELLLELAYDLDQHVL
jgi:hypothetical protein